MSDEYENLNDLLRDSSTISTVDSLKSVQAVQLIVPKPTQHTDPKSSLNYFLNGDYNKQDDSLKYLLVKNTPVHFILHPHFLINYVQQGQLHIQTDDDINELDDSITLLADGQLLICVNQSTYTKLGLVGQLAYGYKKTHNLRKYIVEIDLNDRLIYEFDSKYYQRTFNALKNCGLKLDLLIKWIPENESCSPMSLIRFFDKLKYQKFDNDAFFDEKSFEQITVHQCAPNVRKFELDQFAMPFERTMGDLTIGDHETTTTDDEEFTYSNLKTLIDSFGLALSGSYLPDEEDDEINTFRLDKSKLTNLVCLEISGFLTVNNIRTILSEQFDLIKQNVEYTVLIVNGFENSIRTWSGQSNQHLKCLSGESVYGIFLSRSNRNFIWRVGDRNDFGIEKL